MFSATKEIGFSHKNSVGSITIIGSSIPWKHCKFVRKSSFDDHGIRDFIGSYMKFIYVCMVLELPLQKHNTIRRKDVPVTIQVSSVLTPWTIHRLDFCLAWQYEFHYTFCPLAIVSGLSSMLACLLHASWKCERTTWALCDFESLYKTWYFSSLSFKPTKPLITCGNTSLRYSSSKTLNCFYSGALSDMVPLK